MKIACLIFAAFLAVPAGSQTGPVTTAQRDLALKRTQAYAQSNNGSNRKLTYSEKETSKLEDAYWQGDKKVLPKLLKMGYLTWFYGKALNADPEGFLTAMSHLPEANRQWVTASLGGGMFGVPRPWFKGLRKTLTGVPASSPNFQTAQKLMTTIEAANAEYLVDYFPAHTFTGRGAAFQVQWYSGAFYALALKPMWPPTSPDKRTYRIIVLPSFSPPECVTLTVMPDGSGQVEFRTGDSLHVPLSVDGPRALRPQQVAEFAAALNDINFWHLPTEPPPSNSIGLDGARWILEAVQDGTYHVVDRWCPGGTPFGKAAVKLFELSGRKPKGAC